MRRVFRARRIAVCAGLILALVLFVLAVRASVLRVPGMGGERSSIAQPSVTAQPQSAGEQKGGDSAKSSATAKSTNSEAQSNGHDPSKPFSQAQRREILEKAQQTAAAVVVEATATIAAPDTAKAAAATDSCRPGRPHAAGTAWRIIGRLFEGSAPP